MISPLIEKLLGESHYYFHTTPGGLMFPMGSWYTSRAFNAPEQGGQPKDFPLGIMELPAMDDGACPECKSLNVAGSYCVNADSSHPERPPPPSTRWRRPRWAPSG